MKKKRIYTKKMHIYRTKMMLKSSGLGNCPAGQHFFISWRLDKLMERKYHALWINDPCVICQACADIDCGCPCNRLSKKEALRRLNDETLQRKV